MTLDRRDFLITLSLSFFSCGVFRYLLSKVDKPFNLFATAYMDQKKRYGIAILDQDKNIMIKYQLPERGHGMAQRVKGIHYNSPYGLVSFARRPGNFALAIDIDNKRSPILFKTPAHTHFYGHGVFSADGKVLFATENEFEEGRGLIGIYDATDSFIRIGSFPSYGVGPHEVIMLPDKNTLCVANGGILTHPDTGRTKLNLHEMRSSITFIDSRDGSLIKKLDVPIAYQRLSLRHMAVDHKGTIWIGGQYEGDHSDNIPLIATISLIDLERGLQFFEFDSKTMKGMANYIGSVASGMEGKKIAFTSPKGNILLVVNVETRSILVKERLYGVCGVAYSSEDFLALSMSGKTNGGEERKFYWDNHLFKLNSTL